MSIETRIKNLNGLEDLQSLLVEAIGFEPENRAVFFDDKPELQAAYHRPAVVAGLHGFYILVLPTTGEGMRKTRQRQAIEALRGRYLFALFVFVDLKQPQREWHWVFPTPGPATGRRTLRRMEIGSNSRLHTIAERIELLRSKLPECTNQAAVAAQVQEAFDVEAISKAFFIEYRKQYLLFKTQIVADNRGKPWVDDDKKISRYAQLLLGRIMFLHFIEKKGWLDGNRDFIRDLFEPFRRSERRVFHQEVLEPLFFRALGREGGRKTIAGAEYAIPFLNGGLFEARAEFAEDDPLFGPVVADELFAGLFDMLGRYNFTVDESTPLDQTVGIDPEMLGKVFENLLEAEARHASGTYYTPRSIVEYMCREILFHYLHSHTDVARVVFDTLLDCALDGRKADIETALAQRLDAVLDRVTILDPAVGSGAFLLGMMQEILTLKESLARARGNSEEHIRAERAKRKAVIIHESLYAVDISFPAIEIARLRLWLALVVDETGPHPLPNLDYHILRGDTLQTLLDGKPLLPPGAGAGGVGTGGASGLAPGGQIPFPIAGTQRTLDDHLPNPYTETLLRHLDALYSANGEEKVRLRQEIRAVLTAMIETYWIKSEKNLQGRAKDLLEATLDGNPQKLSRPKLKEYLATEAMLGRIEEDRRHLRESREQNEELKLPFTPLHLYFAEVFSGDNPGFDIVIANPPYVRHEKIKDIKPQLETEFPDFYCSTADLYTYFYRRGLELLKRGGHLCFIAPNKFMRAGYGENTRKLLTSEAIPRVIIDFGDTPIFDATTYPAILLIEKTRLAGPITAAVIKNAADVERIGEAVSERGFSMLPQDLRVQGWTLESPAVLALMTKLRSAGQPLGKYVQGRFYRGILTGFNKAFVIDATTRAQLVAEDANSVDLIKPWLRGRDIRKWKAEWAGLYILAIGSSANRQWPWSDADSKAEAERIFAAAYPAIYEHLRREGDAFAEWKHTDKKKQQGLYSRDDQGKYWWELRSCAYYAQFEQPKIVYPDIAQTPKFTWDASGALLGNTAYIIPTDEVWLIGLLNSKLIWWFYLNLSSIIRGGFVRFIAQYMEQLPVLSATPAEKTPIIRRVETILADPSSPDVPRLEAEIDELVFDLYNLTKAERQLVLAARIESCEDEAPEENDNDTETTSTARSAPESMANQPSRCRKPAGSISPTGAEIHPEFDGAGKRTGQSRAADEAAQSTGLLDATRELATAGGPLAYSEVAECLAVSIARCLGALLENLPEDIRITPEWICDMHHRVASELFPQWAGRFRITDVQVGTHLPPPGHEIAAHIKNFCLDLEERMRHLHGAESIAALLAWADWRFQWIHPFKDFNGRTGRILLVALAYKLALPPVDPAATRESGKFAYFAALRAADAGDLTTLNDLWLDLLQGEATMQQNNVAET
ncbi:MAG: Fic family protein [Nitrosospira sp.]|nr:Fic family protein [Nitrosospira sp.]